MIRRWAVGTWMVMGLSGLTGLGTGVADEPDPATPSDGAVALEPAFVDGAGPGWVALTGDDFANVNTDEDTWTFREDGTIACTGRPVGVTKMKEPVKNFELVVSWRHLSSGGNSGVFLWAPEKALTGLKKGALPPGGIEVQILDHGYKTQYEAGGKVADWFTCHGDVFPVGSSTMTPFPPTAPKGSRAFPSEARSRPTPQWNHYYVRAIDGEVRLWVNGKEVSGGTACNPAEGYLCLESEGAPIEFRNLRLRRLP